MKGFFSPTTFQKKMDLPLVPQCGLCKLYQDCQSPKMPVSGYGKKKVLICAECPGKNEDKEGTQLVGRSGQELQSLLKTIGINMRRDCWLTNSIICRPHTKDGDNRTPTERELDFCRPNLSKTLKELQPNVIITLGAEAVKSITTLAWRHKKNTGMGTWAGWNIPSIALNSWICPTYHPSFLLRSRSDNRPECVVLEKMMLQHLERAFTYTDKPWKALPNYEAVCEVTFDLEKAARLITSLSGVDKWVSFDLETTSLKPDGPNASILCCSISDGFTSMAFPWLGEVIPSMRRFVTSSTPKVVSNLRFEERWCRAKLGTGVRNWIHDTVLGAHWRDCRRDITSLKFQAFVLLGMSDYDSHLEPYMKGKDEKDKNSENRLKEVELSVLMKYCSIDSLLEVLVAKKQMEMEWT